MSNSRSLSADLVDSGGHMQPDARLSPVTRSLFLARRLMRLGAFRGPLRAPVRRRKREMIPADKKDVAYWNRRRRNNEAARRSREKRRLNDLMLEDHLLNLRKENAQLRAQVLNLRYHSGLSADSGQQVPLVQADKTSIRAPNLSTVAAMHAHSPVPLRAGVWGSSSQETAVFDRMTPTFSSCVGVFDPILGGPSGPRGISGSHGPLGGRRSAEINSRQHVSSADHLCQSKDEAAQLLSDFPALSPSPGALRSGPLLPRTTHNWLLPQTSHSVLCGSNNMPLPWQSSYLCPSPPSQILAPGRSGRFVALSCGAPAALAHLGSHFRPEGLSLDSWSASSLLQH